MRGWIKNNIYYKYENEIQRLRLCGGSWSINLDEIKNKKIETIIYIVGYCQYIISFEEAKKKGFIRTFQGEGKLIVPLKYWRKKQLEPYEKE